MEIFRTTSIEFIGVRVNFDSIITINSQKTDRDKSRNLREDISFGDLLGTC
jgi:hypothetical protein